MKNRKLLISILTAIWACLMSITLFTACGGTDASHTHVYDQQVVYNTFKASDATCESATTYYYSCTCGKNGTETFEFGSALGHDYGDWLPSSNGQHQKICANDNSHTITEDCRGGTATCSELAKCLVCIQSYGELKAHSYTVLNHSETQHWFACACGAYETKESHIPGAEATETAHQRCTTCNYVIAPALGHIHTLHLTKVEATPQSCAKEGNIEYYACDCDKWFTDNTATTEITDKTSVFIAKDDHNYNQFMKSETQHWYACSCGDYETKENHKGGTATCQERAVCSICAYSYGELGEHNYTIVKHNETQHWYECECGTESEQKAHEYMEYNHSQTTYWYECECGLKGEETEKKSVEECVDFVVDIEAGRDIRVLQITDVQTISPDQKRYPARDKSSSATDTFKGYQRYIGQIIERYEPDFIIMTGDNVYGQFDDNGEQLLALIAFMDTFKIPWAPIFGNHDNESNMGVDWQCQQYENSPYCLFKQRELTGNGNYSVGLTQGGELKRVFYMLDSNGCTDMSAISFANGHSKKTVGFGQDQIDWYSESMAEINRSHPDAQLSMAFHIQIYAFEMAMKQYGYNSSTINDNPINLDKLEAAKEAGDFGYIGRVGKHMWDTDNKVWNTIKKYGVDSVFVGHEHCNNASIIYDGVRLTYGQKSSTYDRYNVTTASGGISNTTITSSGTPIMGGTFFDLSETDGRIIDAGLYLYDHALGWDDPVEEETKITIDTIPEGATLTEFDFNGVDFDPTVYTPSVNSGAAQELTDTSNLLAGFTGSVYSSTSKKSSTYGSVGIKFSKTVNADKLIAVFVKMYIPKHTVTDSETPLLRIYNDNLNSILTEKSYTEMGGEYDAWVYIDILPLIKGSLGIIADDGKLAPFTLLYRPYCPGVCKIYFDSITMVSDGDMYAFDVEEELPDGERDFEIVRDKTCYQYEVGEFDGVTGTLKGGATKFMAINEENYSIKFTLTPETFNGKLNVYGYTTESNPTSGICVSFTSSAVTIKRGNVATTVSISSVYEIEVGFVSLFNGNTIYTFVKVNGTCVLWELMEAYQKGSGNIAIVSTGVSDSFTIA